MDLQRAKYEYALRLGDNALVLCQRLGEWCGHGPELEEDLALTNIALDLIGQARLFLQYAAELDGSDKTEDDLAFLRDGADFRNVLLVEQPNGDYAQTIVRQLFFDLYMQLFYTELSQSSDQKFAEIAQKSLKEVNYHIRHSAGWFIRLGDGTDESHKRMQAAVDRLWCYTGELFDGDDVDQTLIANQVVPDILTLKTHWDAKIKEIFAESTLKIPDNPWMASGGKQGTHSEHLGYLLAEMQFLQRAYPGATW
ncbi:MAG: 1,2-phenylacetyl-CoA epoxidase subunit PaaC [Pseudomonadota bacterium]